MRLIRPNAAAVNPRFLFFYFFSEDWRKTIGQNVLSGATVDRIPLTRFPSFPVTVPERAAQDRIASILFRHVTIVRPSRDADYVGEVATQLEAAFEAAGVGSTGQTELGRERIAGTAFVCPPGSLRSTFSRYSADLHQLSSRLLEKNETLRATRDFLLPKLISGEIPVEAGEEAAAVASE